MIEGLIHYECKLQEPSGHVWHMRFWAEDEEHANEQCADALPANDASDLISTYEVPSE